MTNDNADIETAFQTFVTAYNTVLGDLTTQEMVQGNVTGWNWAMQHARCWPILTGPRNPLVGPGGLRLTENHPDPALARSGEKVFCS